MLYSLLLEPFAALTCIRCLCATVVSVLDVLENMCIGAHDKTCKLCVAAHAAYYQIGV